ncbi:MAG: glycosyltransferase family 4 protein [Betaproteobacteria bacterium]
MPLAAPKKAGVPAQRPAPLRAERPHLCFVSPYLWPVFSRDPGIQVIGGAEVQQAILARLFAAHGHRVTIVTHDYGQPDAVAIDGVTVRKSFAPQAGLPLLRFLHPRLSSTWRAMREADADIYYQRSSAMWTGVMAEFCRRHGKRAVYAAASDRDFVPGKEQIRFARDRWLYRRGLAGVDAVVAQNAFQVESCRQHHGRQATHIPSCYVLPETSFRPAVRRDEGFVLWVGTVHDYKRPEWLLELARRLPQRRFVMIGGPSVGGERFRLGYFEAIREQAGQLPNVRFLGFLPLAEVEPWFDRGHIVVSTSVYEGMPNVFLQAWARGIPTLATVDVGVKENIVFKDPEAGAAELENLFVNEEKWRAASRRCLDYFDRTHSARAVLARYEELFRQLGEMSRK